MGYLTRIQCEKCGLPLIHCSCDESFRRLERIQKLIERFEFNAPKDLPAYKVFTHNTSDIDICDEMDRCPKEATAALKYKAQLAMK